MELIPKLDSGVIEEGLDRANLMRLRRRFLAISDTRLQRTRAALTHRQRIFLDALPLIFHCNHPMLPGFVSHSAPCGISGFKPGKSDIASGKTLARSFCITHTPVNHDIWGIYLMGSSGTLAHSVHSDFDVWLCHNPELSRSACQELQEKSDRVSQWAQSLRLDVHIFLMNSETFSTGTTLLMDEESSGTAQRLLLLDEFYRTAVYLAGRLPLWWFTPVAEEHHYTDFTATLLNRRYLRPETVLDFGSLHDMPPGEFLGAGIWQLYKAIASPYKSVLKLLLMEAYVSEFPTIRSLAMDFKQRVYHGESNVDRLDPYLLIYQRLEKYLLQEKDTERLELARRCFYYKVNKALSKPPGRHGKSWQRLMLERLVESWGWGADYIRLLDERQQWKTHQVHAERNQLVHALNRSYEALHRFADHCGAALSMSQTELTVLGRKLQAAFERRPGKLDWINPAISNDLSEPVLSLRQRVRVDVDAPPVLAEWQLFGSITGPHLPLRKSSSPAELLLWCHLNGVIADHPQFELGDAPSLNELSLRRALARLRQWLPDPLPAQGHSVFLRPAEPARVLLLVNLGAESGSDPDESGLQILSDRNDPFNYGSRAASLVSCVDVVIENSWHELTCQHFHGPSALLDALHVYMALCVPGSYQAPPELTIDCLSRTGSTHISQRVRQWFAEICHCYYSGIKPSSTRYIFRLAGQFYSLQFEGPRLVSRQHADRQQLLNFLGERQGRYSPIMFDTNSFMHDMLGLIARRATAQALHVFYLKQEEQVEVSVVDEMGSLVIFHYPHTPQLFALNSLHIFLRAVLAHDYHHLTLAREYNYGVQPIEFHEIRDEPHYPLSLNNRIVTTEFQPSQWLDLKVTAHPDSIAGLGFSFDCLQQHFSWQVLGERVFTEVARLILEQRRQRERYPVYITDLDLSTCRYLLSDDGYLQTSQYLRIKDELEQKLNRALLDTDAMVIEQIDNRS